MNDSVLKSGLPKISAMIGVSRSATSALTTAAKAVPITKATARSTMLPRAKKFLNSTASPRMRPAYPLAAGAGEFLRRYCVEDRIQSPRLVNATITVSIQYCERVASRARR